MQVVYEGANIVDIGGIKAAAGHEISVNEQIRRVVSLVERIHNCYPDLVISVKMGAALILNVVMQPPADTTPSRFREYRQRARHCGHLF